MLNPIDLSGVGRPQREPASVDAVNNVFKVLHGFYGNLFLSKFSTGEADASGADKGIQSARQVWVHGLRDFDASTVKAALSQCITQHPEFPPSLPQFVALCVANKVRDTFQTDRPLLAMSSELRSRYTAEARATLALLRQQTVDMKTGYIELPQSLDGLKRAIANAVACAGGDEVATLLRLDRELAPRSAA